ncbi:hypothetical protein [Dyadobacter sp. 676]|uniref:DUF805 domain-containing protein n=1 Tax=Dyadobacter sp. 676 TaxID=3088362 RepID=A0AAU8FK67_9BACT
MAIGKLGGALARRSDTWLYVGLFCWISVGSTMGRNDPWPAYFQSLLILVMIWSPVLLVTWVREGSGEGRFAGRNRRYWFACFLGYLPLLSMLSGALMVPGRPLWGGGIHRWTLRSGNGVRTGGGEPVLRALVPDEMDT